MTPSVGAADVHPLPTGIRTHEVARVRPHSVGLVFGALLALWHAVWAFLVAVGGAQVFLDWIFRLHMIAPVYQVESFDLGTAITLVVVTGAIGFVGGWFAGYAWNRFGRRL